MSHMPEDVSTKKKGEGPDKWEIESWCRTITEAEEIRSDQEKMKHVAPMLAKKAKAAIKTMEQLRARSKVAQEEEEDDDADS